MAKVTPLPNKNLKQGKTVKTSSLQSMVLKSNKSLGEIGSINDDSMVDLDYEKNLTKLDYEKMKQSQKEHHATKTEDTYYNCKDVCYKFEPGSHYCMESSEKSDLNKFGVGIMLYFKFVKHLIFFFLMFIILSIPALVFYIASFSAYNSKGSDLSYLDLLTATTVGSIGLGASSCSIAKHPNYNTSEEQTEMSFQCVSGTISNVNNIEFGLVKTGQTCSFIDLSDINSKCNLYDSSTLNSTFSACTGKTSCNITIPSGMFKAVGADTYCDTIYQNYNIYVQVSCDTTTLTLFGSLEIAKSTIALTVALCDAVIIIIFIVMVYSLKYAQKSATRNVLKTAYSASSYTLQIRNLPQDLPSEELAGKLWSFFDHRLGNKDGSSNHRVVDVQIVLPNKLIAFSRKLGKIIQKKNTLIREFMQLYAIEFAKNEIDFKGVQKIVMDLKKNRSPNAKEATQLYRKIRDCASQKTKILNTIQKLKTTKNIKIVCAFVTFSSIIAKNKILDMFSSSPIDRLARSLCKSCYSKDTSFLGKHLVARTASDPGSILWENLGEPGPKIFLRRMTSLFLTVLLWVISGGILLVSTYYKNYFKEEYPEIDCSQYDPTMDEAAVDYSRGQYQIGLLGCYCSEDIFGRINTVFTAANNQKLCYNYFQDKITEMTITFAIVFGVLVVNYGIQFIFQGLSKFEKHSSLNKQLAQRVIKTFVAQFLNTGILILLINAKVEKISFWQGKFKDLSPLWYENVGSTLLSTMFINIFTVPTIKAIFVLFNKIRRLCDRGCTSDERKTKKKTQPEYEKLYAGPEFIIDFRYSQILTLTFVCFLYSGGMPFLYVTSFAQLIITYYFDKLFLLRVCKLPKNYDEKLEQVVRITLYGIIILHLLFTIFMYGNPSIFNQQTSTFDALSSTISDISSSLSEESDSMVTKFFRRAALSHAIPLVVLLFIFLIIFLVNGVLLGFLKRTVFAFFARDSDQSRKIADSSKPGKVNPNYSFFQVIKSEDIAQMIKITKVTMKQTQNETLKTLFKKKIEFLKQQYILKRNAEDNKQLDADVNFIGFHSYDIRLHPTYKEQFAIEEQLDDENLN